MYAQEAFDAGDTAWVMVCTALVLIMIPGLAIFYAGMVRSRNALTMLQQNIVPLGVVSVLWVLVGYSIAFSTDIGGLFGDLELFGLRNLGTASAPAFHLVAPNITIPTLAFVAYQMMFAIITPALITGATAGRLKAAGWIVFIGFWSVLVYAPITHWLWGPDGWLSRVGAQDWAGGMVVHASAGAAVIALLIVVGRRKGWPGGAALPHSLPLTIIGAGLLWFGWFGFNGGDGLQANGVAAQAILNTHLAAAAGLLIWIALERILNGHATVLGSVTGAVAGLATITPCAGYVSSVGALAIGALAGLICHLALKLKSIFRFDDALDVVAVHFVGGALGTLLLGFFADQAIHPSSANGVFNGGGFGLLGNQALALVSVAGFSFALTWLIAITIQKTMGLRVDPDDQARLDQVQQGMDAYHLDHVANLPGAGNGRGEPPAVPTAQRATSADVSLVTALLDPYELNPSHLIEGLHQAGGVSIVVSDVYLYGSAEPQVVRGEQRPVDFPNRLRVEVVVPQDRIESVLAELHRFSGRADEFTQVIKPEVVIHP